MNKKTEEFLRHSNYIEREYGENAFEDAKEAWKFAYKNRKKIDISYIMIIHSILMRRLRPDIAGKLRTCDVWIGGERKNFLTTLIFEEQLKRVLDNMKEPKYKITREGRAKFNHILFEDVHPFEDGNGRVGRILWQIHRINMKLPIKIIHEGEEQMEYYKWFR